MKRKLLILAIIVALVITLPIVVAVLTKTLTIHIEGNSKYPHNVPPSGSPTPTPIPTPTSSSSQTIQFTLFTPNGESFPTSTTGSLNGGVNTVVVDPLTGHNAGWTATCIVVRNDGNVPITVNASVANKKIPSDMDLTLNCGWYGTIAGSHFSEQATDQQPIQPGKAYYMSMIAFLTPTTSDYTPDQAFSYSYDVVVTATQA
ncbi:MAG: hypothetical protein NWF01_05270 [Candidatus Bathyarchaeota archaeon]|nr:hypothetical protein [Candidatus Bathyarchaeota archaeon]